MWPFRKKWKPVVGEAVLLNASRSIYWKQDWDNAYPSVVEQVIDDERLFGVRTENGYPDFGKTIYVKLGRMKRIQLLEERVRGSKPAKDLVDARILHEVVELVRVVGGTEATIDLLRSIREPYDSLGRSSLAGNEGDDR